MSFLVLGVRDAELEGIHEGHDQLGEKVYQMLKNWRQKEGSAVSIQTLANALVCAQRKDLAKMFYHSDGNYLLQYY